MKNNLLFLVFLLFVYPLTMAAHELDPTSHQANIVPSTEVWAMSRYGSPTPSLYTGAMSYSVPVYTYKDPDFTIPISLDYHFDGYKLIARSGTVGMGWFLNCGGVITREVVGMPDEECVQNSLHNFNCGYRYLYDGRGRNHTDISTYESSFYNGYSDFGLICSSALGNMSVMQEGFERCAGNVLSCNTPLLVNFNDLSYDSRDAFDFSSDIYHFSALGMSGDFVLGPNGRANVYNSNVPYGELTVRYTSDSNLTVMIEILTSDGYSYTFMSNNDDRCNFSCDPWFGHLYEHRSWIGDPSLKKSISSFRLDSITAPNGRKVEFEYNNCACELICRKIYRPRINNYDYVNGVGYFNGEPFVSTISAVSHNLTGIKIGGNRIVEFNYASKTKAEDSPNAFLVGTNWYTYFDPSFEPDGITPYPSCLSSVRVYNRGHIVVETATLEHCYTSSSDHSSPKMFLKSVTTNAGKTSFEYNHASETDRYPSIDCFATDHWGYYCGEGTGMPFNPNSGTDWQTWQDNDLYNIPNDGCAPSFTTTMYGALTRITCPTGSNSRIEYEQNDAGKRVNRTMDRGVFVEDNDEFPVGGVRVKNVMEYDKNGNYKNNTVYRYKNQDNTSSGTIQWMPRYSLKRRILYSIEETRIKWDIVLNWHIDTLLSMVHQCEFLALNSQGVYSFHRGSPVGYSHVITDKIDGSRVEYDFFDNEDYMDTFGGFSGRMYCKSASTVSPEAHPESVTGNISIYTQLDSTSHPAVVNILSPVTRSLSCIRGKLHKKIEYDSDNRPRLQVINNYDIQRVASRIQMHDVLFGFVPYEVSFVSPLLVSTHTTQHFVDSSLITIGKLMTYNTYGQISSCRENSITNGKRTDYEYYNNSMDGGRPHLLHKKTNYTRHYGNDVMVSRYEYFYNNNGNPNPERIRMETPDGASKELYLTYNDAYRLTEAHFPGGAYYKYIWDINNLYIYEKETDGPAMKDQYVWLDLVGLAGHTDPYGHIETYTYDAKKRLQSVSKDGEKIVGYEYNVINQ